ncbi:hypothetical protein HYX00_05525 [Candidatus Woesearchaeota archaeon]|nr:hypothetical protein [Candidatus Woesearchaeota archaeon]
MEVTTKSAVSIIIILVTIVLLVDFLFNVRKGYADITAKEECKVGVNAHAKLRLRYDDFSGDIKCQTVYLKVNREKEDVIKKKIADAMYDCWGRWQNGKLDLFAGDSVYCHICTRITFDKDVKINGFANYLATKNIPGQKISYLQYLTTERTQNSDFLDELEDREIADTLDASKNNEYAVIFSYIKGKKYVHEYSKKVAYTAPGAGLTIIGLGLIYYTPAVTAAVASIPIVGTAAAIPAGSLVATTGTITFGIGALWDYLAWKYVEVPFEHISLISLIPYDVDSIKSLNCRELPIKQ